MQKMFSVFKFMAALLGILFLCIGGKAEAASEKITGVRQIGDSFSSVGISWEWIKEDISGYQIEYCENSSFRGNSYGRILTGAQVNSAWISELLPGTSYQIRISALDREGNVENSSDILEAVTAPEEKVKNILQTGADKAFVSFSWSSSQGANVYRVDWINYFFDEDAWNSWVQEEVGNTNSHQLPTLEHAFYDVCVYAGRKSSSGYVAYADEGSEQYMIRPMPQKITGVRMLISGWPRAYPMGGVARFGWNQDKRAVGYQYAVYGHNGRKLFSGTTEGYLNEEVQNKKLTNDQFMQIKVRGYIMVNGKKKYGKWSDACYFAKRPGNVRFVKMSGGRFKMTWDKVKGAGNYTVYASRKQNSGYQKLGSTSKNSYIIKKVQGRKLVSGKVYFFKLIAHKKVGKKRYSSDDNWYLSRIY